MFTRSFPFFVFLFCFFQAKSQMTVRVTATPQLTPILDTLYVAGNFNFWNARSEAHRMEWDGSAWTAAIDATEGSNIQFKITRGSWATVEGNATGGYISNRNTTFTGGTTENIEAAGWEDIGGTPTVTAHVRILDSNFLIPQLGRTRRVWISFPPDYETTTDHYPVIYMHDAQNVFNAGTSFAGEWEVDESTLEAYLDGCTRAIIVGVDNGGSLRLDEYAPWVNAQYNEGGEGAEFSAFFVETLKPYIDEHYRTLPDRPNTGVMGSSLGGLISAYMLFTYPETFGRAGIFSPAYWFNTQIFDLAASATVFSDTKIYQVCATNEGNGSVLQDMNQMHDELLDGGYAESQLFKISVANGAHSEWFWAQEFPAAYAWLTDCTNDVATTAPANFTLYPSPADSSVTLRSGDMLENCSLQVLDNLGRRVMHRDKLSGKMWQLDIALFTAGKYHVVLHNDSGMIYHGSFLKQ